jgi:catechol 2,3-dioxygenase-like lactoylglutathione lyase family enzyme
VSTIDTSRLTATPAPEVERGAMRLEVVALPVIDVDRAKEFYVTTLGWRLDADFDVNRDFRVVQVTPPGSPCSVHFGRGITAAAPGSVDHMYLVVCDIDAEREDLLARGVDVSEIFHSTPGQAPEPGPEPGRTTYQSYASFSDPEGNRWTLQEITTRLPGR